VGSIISAIASALVGGALAITAVVGVVQSSTKAPDKNPAASQIVDYGNR